MTPITDTGLRGFLKWARQEYPADLYQKLATAVQQRIPQAFSGYLGGGWKTLARLNGLADTTATVDTADAANSTASDPSWSDQISQIIGTITAGYLDVKQQQQQQQIVNTQLQQAQNGKTPIPMSLSSAGITFGSAGSSVGTAILVGGAIYLGLKLVGVIK